MVTERPRKSSESSLKYLGTMATKPSSEVGKLPVKKHTTNRPRIDLVVGGKTVSLRFLVSPEGKLIVRKKIGQLTVTSSLEDLAELEKKMRGLAKTSRIALKPFFAAIAFTRTSIRKSLIKSVAAKRNLVGRKARNRIPHRTG